MVKELRENIDISSFFRIIKEYSKKIPGISNFVLVGEKKVEIDGIRQFYNIHMRYNCMGNKERIDFVFNDNTQAREVQSTETKYKTIFFSKVAHEFKNPLICITELVEQLNDTEKSQDERNHIVAQINSLSNFMLVLVKDLNYFSEYEIGKETNLEYKEVDIDTLLRFCEDITNALMKKLKRENLNMKIDKQKDLKIIWSDEWRLRQILLNLLSNAVKFTYNGLILIKVFTDSDSLIFQVHDTGIGIKEENKGKLFKPFSMEIIKQNDLGSGLGLFIVKEITCKFGGELRFESEHNKGTIFTLILPHKFKSKRNSEIASSENREIIEDSKITNCREFIPPQIKEECSIFLDINENKYSLYEKKHSNCNLCFLFFSYHLH